MKKEHTLVYLDDQMYLPIEYRGRLVERPIFQGEGNHNVRELETICRQFETYCHQQQIIKQNCMRIIVELKTENLEYGI